MSFSRLSLQACHQEYDEPSTHWAQNLLMVTAQSISWTIRHCAECVAMVVRHETLMLLGVRDVRLQVVAMLVGEGGAALT